MLQVENLTFSYARGKENTLSNFSLSIEKGKVYGLLGKNGAGKSTLLSLMSGLLLSSQIPLEHLSLTHTIPKTKKITLPT